MSEAPGRSSQASPEDEGADRQQRRRIWWRDCAKAQTAARRLAEIGDRRAIGPLRDVASQKRLAFFDTCEAPAARAALRKLEKP